MLVRIRELRLLLAFLLISLDGTGMKAKNQPHDEPPPTLETVKSLSYMEVRHAPSDDTPDYQQVRDIIVACQSYARAARILDRFHEPILTRGETGISVFRRVSPSVVLVVTGNYKGDKLTDVGLGTGVIIDPSGYVLTNWHVIAGYEAGVIFLKPTKGTEPEENSGYGVRLVAQDDKADLALLKIVKAPAGLPVVKFGDVSLIQVGEDIHIIGHPHGQLWSYSTGVVSQIRDNYEWEYADGSKHLSKVLQMQTAINPGNSGGPVLDNNSNMLGLVAMSEEGQNLNYAVAIDVIANFVSRSMAARSRGSQESHNVVNGQFYTGQTKDGYSVTKAVYTDFVSYTIRDPKGVPVELCAQTPHGEILVGSKPNGFGGFGQWTFTLSDGTAVYAQSSGVAPGQLSFRRVD
jgi:S1-C subfamily serine protease